MSRLTGLELLWHHENELGLTITQKVIKAGYVGQKEDGSLRVYFTDYYTELLKSQGWRERIRLSQDNGGSDTVKSIIKAIETKIDWKRRNDSVYVNEMSPPKNDQILVRFHGNLYCYIQYKKLYLTVPPQHKTKSTKERLNRILMKFCGCQLYQKNRVWYIHHPQVGDIEYTYGMEVPFVNKVYKD